MWFHNLKRLDELATEEGIQKAAQALIRLPSKPVLKALSIIWGAVLIMAFSMIFIVRLALSIPFLF